MGAGVGVEQCVYHVHVSSSFNTVCASQNRTIKQWSGAFFNSSSVLLIYVDIEFS